MRSLIPILIVACLLAAGCSDSDNPDARTYSNGVEVLDAMQLAHGGSWYETLTFVQTTINFSPNGSVDTTTWYEAMKLPGKLRIDIGSPTSGETMIFRNDSIYVYSGGELSNSVPTLHPLLLLGFDVYHLPRTEVIARLDTLGFDLSKTYETQWQERPVIAVGADAPGTENPEFWVDRERMVFLRLLQNVGPNNSIRQDVRFADYRQLDDAWVAPKVLFYADSTITMEEKYEQLTPGRELEDAFFHPSTWQDAEHWFTEQPPGR